MGRKRARIAQDEFSRAEAARMVVARSEAVKPRAPGFISRPGSVAGNDWVARES